jgi:hypothetical protein
MCKEISFSSFIELIPVAVKVRHPRMEALLRQVQESSFIYACLCISYELTVYIKVMENWVGNI